MTINSPDLQRLASYLHLPWWRWFSESLLQNDFVEDIDEELMNPTDKRIFAIAIAFHRGYSVEKIWQMSNIDKWFLTKLQSIYNMEEHLS